VKRKHVKTTSRIEVPSSKSPHLILSIGIKVLTCSVLPTELPKDRSSTKRLPLPVPSLYAFPSTRIDSES
jgi:hypothetical protein